jgi:di/tripeptidase
VLDSLARQVGVLVQAAVRPDVQVNWEIIGDRPQGSLSVDHPLVQLAQRALQAQGIQPALSIGSTDANIPLSRGLPAICLGISHGSGAHTIGEYILTSPVGQGLSQLVSVVEGAFQLA